MPIRINLLAEAKAIEDQRRRDPAKRVVFAGVLSIILIVFWCVTLFINTMSTKSDLKRYEGELSSRTNEYKQILENEAKLRENKMKLDSLYRLATNRFLVGNLLDTLQNCTMDDVQLVRLKLAQTYVVVRPDPKKVAPADAKGGRSAAEKAATSTEKIMLTLDAKDTSDPAGDAFTKFQALVSSAPFFQEQLGKTNTIRLANIGRPQTSPDGKTFVLFTLEAHFQEKVR
jgi:hypothetical protein